MKKHYIQNFNCAFFDDEKTKKAAFVVVKKKKNEIVVVEETVKQIVIKTIKFKICVENLNFFNFTIILNLLKFHISINNAIFLFRFVKIVLKYDIVYS